MALRDDGRPADITAYDITTFVQHDAWEEARARYMEDLTPAEQEVFADASLENIYRDASNAQKSHERASISRGLVTKLKPLVEGISQYGQALDVFSNASSLILCPLWGSIKVLLHLASEFGMYFERLAQMFFQIGDILPRFSAYEKLFLKHTRVIRAISEVYLDILRFCISAKAVFRKGVKSPFLTTASIGLKLSWRPFEQQYGEALDIFQRHRITAERELELAHRIENMNHQAMTKEMRHKLETMEESRIAQARTDKEALWFEALNSSDYEFSKDNNPERVPGTCEWLLKHDRYLNWLDSKASGVVLVSADPGCGKSVLSRFVVDNPDYANFDPTGALCYFFFKDDSDENRSAYHALSAILHQLFYQKRYLLRIYADKFIHRGRPSFDNLWNILIESSTDARLSSIVCVIDGLDECADQTRAPLIQRLATLLANPPEKAKIKFMVTSRPYTHIKNAFRKGGFDIQKVQVMGENSMGREEISSEIGLVISEKIKQFREARLWNEIDDDAHEVLAERLARIVNRTYLWIALVFPELEMYAGASKRELIAVLDTLPRTIIEAYEKILDRSLNREKATKLLHIVTGAMRPMSLSELNLAMAIEEGDKSEADVCLTPLQSFSTLIRDLCGLFIEINRGRVYLVHQSAKEFLQQNTSPLSPVSPPRPTLQQVPRWENSLEVRQSHRILAFICIWYLSLDTFRKDMAFIPDQEQWIKHRLRSTLVLERPKISFVEEHEFIRYASTYWEDHYKLAEKDDRLTEAAKSLLPLESG